MELFGFVALKKQANLKDISMIIYKVLALSCNIPTRIRQEPNTEAGSEFWVSYFLSDLEDTPENRTYLSLTKEKIRGFYSLEEYNEYLVGLKRPDILAVMEQFLQEAKDFYNIN
jgi:hypothetical protein